MASDRILAIDVGAGTQDVLLWEADQPVENSVKLVLPSWTTVLARRVKRATKQGRPIFLAGNLMGGGPVVSAMKRHLRAGYPVYTTPRSALTIRDSVDEVRGRGYTILAEGEDPPENPDTLTLLTRDVDIDVLESALAPFDVEIPDTVAVAVQDHGECLEGSNRRFRFELWRDFVEGGGRILDLVYREPPACYTRMLAVQRDVPGAILMDTGSAALWGILEDRRAAARQDDGFILVNVGNQHTLGVLLRGERILGLFEHHTVLMDVAKLHRLIRDLRAGSLTNDAVYADNGHGAYVHPDYVPGNGFDLVAVTGPQRRIAQAGKDSIGGDMIFAAPYGDMMLTGCFGLVAATRRLTGGREASL
ncbi:MAG: DUF1786 domain-containing protein [Anaerolineae bacterium]|jgi:uncharacterized protein (DUF1786 family)